MQNNIQVYNDVKTARNQHGVFRDNFNNVYDFHNNTLNGIHGEFSGNVNSGVVIFKCDENNDQNFHFNVNGHTFSNNGNFGKIRCVFLDGKKMWTCNTIISPQNNFSINMDNGIVVNNVRRTDFEISYNKVFNNDDTADIIPSLTNYYNEQSFNGKEYDDKPIQFVHDDHLYTISENGDEYFLEKFNRQGNNFSVNPASQLKLKEKLLPVALKGDTLILNSRHNNKLFSIDLQDMQINTIREEIPEPWRGMGGPGRINWGYANRLNPNELNTLEFDKKEFKSAHKAIHNNVPVVKPRPKTPNPHR